ncbi:MAG: hypothetical protein CK531_11250 [Gemmatimonadetes bacterium]|nr:MAG: hypothetical protein CK531_11250 [Gemmatimonadota bacterium]
MPTAPRTLVAVLEERLRLRHSSPRTVEAYCSWVRRYVQFHRGTHLREMGERDAPAVSRPVPVEATVSSRPSTRASTSSIVVFRWSNSRLVLQTDPQRLHVPGAPEYTMSQRPTSASTTAGSPP